jgi:hypothetical protein
VLLDFLAREYLGTCDDEHIRQMQHKVVVFELLNSKIHLIISAECCYEIMAKLP